MIIALSIVLFVMILHDKNVGGVILSPELFFNDSLVQLRNELPRVLILPINPSFYQEMYIKHKFKLSTYHGLRPHYHDVAYTLFFNQSYEKTVRSTNRTVKTDYYYLPTFRINSTDEDSRWWTALDAEIERIKVKYDNFLLDRVILPASHPNSINARWKTSEKFYQHYRRNVGDLRLFRVDNDMSVNGREVYIPFIVNTTIWRLGVQDSVPRQFFMTAACKEAGGKNDQVRMWRTHLYKEWHETPNSHVFVKPVDGLTFEMYFKHSDFCIIIPGDMSSTSKLYKAVFSGCIPVIFVSFPSQLPFYNVIDWRLFSVVYYKDYIRSPTRMKKILTDLQHLRQDTEKLSKMKQYISQAAVLFDYGRVEFPSVYHLTLLQMVRIDNREYIAPN